MTERVFLKPAPLEVDGQPTPRKVRKPTGPYLAADGEEVNLDTYWRRRLDAGEVEKTDAPAMVDAPAKKTKAAP